MKKSILFIIVILSGFISTAQDCGSYIELIGSGISGQSSATILIEDLDQVESIRAEVIYKSYTPPTQVRFWSESEEIFAEPVDVPISGFQSEGVITSVFRATFDVPAANINLDILLNSKEFYSMAVYVHRKNGPAVSYMEGELYHVYQNEDKPLVTNIPVQKSDHSRDITLRFGISELNQDGRWAEFIFEAGGETKSMEIWEWDSPKETDSYTIREVKFSDVDGDIDKIKMTMLSENHETDAQKGDSYIAGVVLVDIPCEYEEWEAYCSYTQGYYGNEGGKTCKGESTRELLNKLLMEDLVLGDGDYTFTIPAGGVDCVLGILPGGGPSKVLSGPYGCDNLGDIATNKQGRIKNTLLAQGITLALNLRNSPNLMSFPVDGMDFETWKTEDCSNPESEDIYGTEQSHTFGMDVVDYFDGDATIGDLLDLVNSALAGNDITPLSLSNVADAAAMVNEAFDECVLVIYPAESDPDEGEEGDDGEEGENGDEDDGDDAKGDQKGATGVSDASFEEALKLYPNPAKNQITIQTLESGSYFIEISTINGQVILKSEFYGATYQADLSSLDKGVYFLKIKSETQLSTRKIVKQ